MQEISAHSKQSHHFTPTFPYQDGNSRFTVKTKPLSSSLQCPSVHQVLASRFASADNVMAPSLTSRVTHQTQCLEAHGFHTLSEELKIWEMVVPSVTNQLALVLSQRHQGWGRGDGKEQPGHRNQGQCKREHEGSLGFPILMA